jgi:hypothetical protein
MNINQNTYLLDVGIYVYVHNVIKNIKKMNVQCVK